MASSPDDAGMSRLGDLYQQALSALAGGDFERVRELVEAAEPLLPSTHVSQAMTDSEADAEVTLQARAVQAHRSLLEALAAERDETLAALMRVRQGREALASYGHRLGATGTRLERDG